MGWAFVDRRDPDNPDALKGTFEYVPDVERLKAAAKFADAIRERRIERRVSLREMASAARMTPAQYSALEHARWLLHVGESRDTVTRIAAALGFTWGELAALLAEGQAER